MKTIRSSNTPEPTKASLKKKTPGAQKALSATASKEPGFEENLSNNKSALIKNAEKKTTVARKRSTASSSSAGSSSKEKLAPGTVIGVDRGIYKHYAIYAGRGAVIHYASERGDFGGGMKVRRSRLADMLAGAIEFFVCEFPSRHGKPAETRKNAGLISSLAKGFGPDGILGRENTLTLVLDIYEFFKKMRYKIHTPAETLKRAKSRLGEASYNIAFNNCEHFVVWCKTGVAESHQVNALIKALFGETTVFTTKNIAI